MRFEGSLLSVLLSPKKFGCRIEIDNPLVTSNSTEMRSQALYRLLCQWNEGHHHSSAMEVLFGSAASPLTLALLLQIYTSTRDHSIYEHLYDDVVPCFRWLAQDEQLNIAILSNNTVNIPLGQVATHELGSLVTLSMNSADLGCKKPSPVSYLSITQKLNVHPSRVLFIGDDYECDVVGPRGLGMKTGQLCRHLFSESKESRNSIQENLGSSPDLLLISLGVQEVRQKLYQKFLPP